MTAHVDKQWFLSQFQQKGLSLRKVATRIGLDPSALSRALAGERKMSVVEVAKIATVLELRQADVLKHVAPEAEVASNIANLRGPIRGARRSGFGFMKGLLTVEEGYDLTSPSDEDWERGYIGG